jgi:hypothetical protein
MMPGCADERQDVALVWVHAEGLCARSRAGCCGAAAALPSAAARAALATASTAFD